VSPRNLARVAGLLYLVVAVTSGPAQLFRESLFAPGDPAATAANVRNNVEALRLALVGDMIGIAAFVGVALALYFLFREVGRREAVALLVCVVVSASIEAADLTNHLAAYLLATGPALTEGDRLIALALQLHGQVYYVAEVFFGLWLVPLGLVIWRTGWAPRPLGAALAAGGILYLVALVPVYASASLDASISVAIALPAGIAEIVFAIWLAVVGLTERGRMEAGSGTPTSTSTPRPTPEAVR
jgi:hypothetical protein